MTKISELPLTGYTSTGDDHIVVNHTENSYVNTCQTALSEWISDYIDNSTKVTTYDVYHTILLAEESGRGDHGPNPQRIELADLMSKVFNYPNESLNDYISQYLEDYGGGSGGGGEGGDVSEAIESYFYTYPQYAVNDYLGSWLSDSPYQLSEFISENISNNMGTYLSEVLVSDAYLSEIYSVIYNYPNESLDNYLSQYLNDHLSEFLP